MNYGGVFTDQQPFSFAPPAQKLKLTAYIFKYPKHFLYQALGGVVYNTVVVFGAISLGKTIDAAGLVYAGEATVDLFYRNLLTYLGVTLIFQFARYFKRYYMRMIVNRMNGDIRAGLLDVLFGMPLDALSHERIGDLMSRMIGDVDQVGASVQTTITEIWDTVLLMLSYFVACLAYSPRITLLAAIPIPITIFLAELLRHPLYNLSTQSRQAASKINVHLRHNVSGIALLRLFGLEEANRDRYGSLLQEQYKWQVSASILQGGVGPLYIFVANLGVILVMGMGGEQVVQGVWTIGTFTAYLAMFTAMATRSNTAARVMNTWHGAQASWDRICEKLAEEFKHQEAFLPQTTSQDKSPTEGLLVAGLSFSYPFATEESIKEITFGALPGQIIGITGSVGSGKSALAAALAGLYPYGGTARLGVTELRSLGDKRSDCIAYMDSQHFVFSDDVLFNVALGRDGAELQPALELAALSEDVRAFDKGVATPLMERGVRISGGQRQRIALARAWYGDSDLVILDDPFSAIDIAMEQRIMENIRKNIGEKIVLLFSHRLATFGLTDKVIVLESGQITEMGEHEELLRQEGLYWSIYTAQNVLRGEADA